MKKLRFFKNAVMLTVTGLLLRGLGMVFRIYISSRIGEEGMGIYQLISSAYFLFITIAHAGISATVTRLCAKRLSLCQNPDGAVAPALKLALGTGTLSALIMIFSAPMVTRLWMADARALRSLWVLAFSLPFISVCSVLSAYFTAIRKVSYGCTAQITEQISRLAVAAGALILTKSSPLATVLASVFFANTASEIISCIFLFVCYRGRRLACKDSESIRSIALQSLPIAASKLISSGLHTAENMLVPTALTIFCGSRKTALSDFGALKGMALPLMFFPFSFISALSTLLLPEITEAGIRGGRTQAASIIKKTCNITLTLSVMIAGVFFLRADDLGQLIYKSERVGSIIRVLSPIIPFMYLDSICDGLLKGLGKQRRLLYNNCIDSGIRLVLVMLILSKTGLSGFLIIMIISNMLISILNLRLLTKSVQIKININEWFLAPFGCAAASAIITNFLCPLCATLTKKVLSAVLFCLIFVILRSFYDLVTKKYKNIKKSSSI